MPTDRVELKTRRSDHFRAGDEVTVKRINPRHPNVLQVENDDGQTTFISHYDMIFEQKNAENPTIQSTSSRNETEDATPISSSYLDWP
jgi:IMP cyclohydrolase